MEIKGQSEVFGLKSPCHEDFNRGTLQTKGYEIFPRIPSQFLAMATKCKYFFNYKDILIMPANVLSLFSVTPVDYSLFPDKIHTKYHSSYADVLVAIWLTVVN